VNAPARARARAAARPADATCNFPSWRSASRCHRLALAGSGHRLAGSRSADRFLLLVQVAVDEMPRYLTSAEWDAAFNTLEEQGFVIIPSYFDGEQLEAMAAAQRRVLPTWDELRQDLPEGFDGTMTCDWPYSELILNTTGAQQPELVNFARRWLGTEDIQVRVGIGLARYPGFKGRQQGVHVGKYISPRTTHATSPTTIIMHNDE